MIAQTALQEDVQVVGLSILSGAHLVLVPEILRRLREMGLGDVLLVVGGIIPDSDIPALKAQGVHMVFTPGTPLPEVVDYVRKHAPKRT
jgi:methylmalonyl-CoA mutase C-terminal domain/subunit